MAEITKIEQTQKIDYDFSHDLPFEPPTIPEYYTTQDVQRTISMLLAQEAASKQQTALTCTAAGRLLTSSLANQFTTHNTGYVFRSDALIFTLDFDEPRSVVKLFSFVALYLINLDKGDGVWGADIVLPYGEYYVISYATQRIRFKPHRSIKPAMLYWEWWG